MLSSLPEAYSEEDEGLGLGGGIGTKLSRRGGSVTVERSELSVSSKTYTDHASDNDDRVYAAIDFMQAEDFEKAEERKQFGFKVKRSMPTRHSNFNDEKIDVLNMSDARRTWDTYSALTDSQPLPPSTEWVSSEGPDAEYTALGHSGNTRGLGSAVRRSSCTALDSESDDDDACDAQTPPPPTRRTWPAAHVQPLKDLKWTSKNPKVEGVSMYSLLHFESSPRDESNDTSDAGDSGGGVSLITKMPPRKRSVEKETCKPRR